MKGTNSQQRQAVLDKETPKEAAKFKEL